MSNFKDSFGRGLQAAEIAASLNAEINSVFQALNKDISEASGGKIKIHREIKVNLPNFVGTRRLTGAMVSGLLSDISKNDDGYNKILASNPLARDSKSHEIAKFKQHRNGYPCEVVFEDEKIVCDDKPALERALSYMLSDAEVGRKLQNLMSLTI
ncbi:hypothetical protein V0R55_22010 [Pseudomonas soli]|uniref:Uncharacterized protein n=1 Tax=Pseudomonas soli TaxID=1306993 RepID=A0ABU7GV13_9PSED|nr:hypothetical protein [Pseudomonas soli]MEE1882840.1 hypothetical protein [Pseudomonas soli]